MNIISTQYSIETQSFDIFVSGCNSPHCYNCCNPESWDHNNGIAIEEIISKIYTKIITFSTCIKRIFLLGGDPLDNNHLTLLNFIYKLQELKKEIWLFTKYEKNNIPEYIFDNVSFIKCGKYIFDNPKIKTEHGFYLASNNQYIIKGKWTS